MDCDVLYEELAACASGDLDPKRQAEIAEHLPRCRRCRQRLAAIKAADAALRALRPPEPPGGAILAARRALAELTRAAPAPEIMTLAETAEFLRLEPEQLGEIVEELPAFELAGQVRVRRARLVEWIRQRERTYARQAAASWVARGAANEFEEGVAP